MLLARGETDLGGLSVDLALDVVERADTIQRLARDGGFRLVPCVMEVAPQMRPAGRLLQTGRAVGAGFVKLGIALVAIGLQDAARLGEMPMDVLLLPVRGEAVDRPGGAVPAQGRGSRT